ncbi:hypothetical protein FGG08_001911 [Glutinoglossum americanum]|uniref:DASH complex subunit DAD2 n=1 Tax=Glutinoglossum americanum TaxID=1670608 RepID=A0A9P8IG69_9PEZI|nr:hypothetical protein FGG08_001911 [Glutinoglossum americanum]
MSYGNRPPLGSQLRNPSTSGSSSSTSQSPALVTRINEKKTELENLKQLRDLSAGLASQMQMLEEKLATLADGTEAKLPKPQDPEDEHEEAKKEPGVPLPQTLVRIPTQQESLQPQSSSGGHEE